LKWVTWKDVGIDRIACAWLIRKRIDPDAEFLFIRRGADHRDLDAVPFDIPGANLSHKRGKCSFCTILREYGIEDKVMDQICKIVNAADTLSDALPPPESAGADLICRGLAKSLKDDARALEVGGMIFDAIYVQLEGSA
jgi:hypothetical protein